MHAGIRSTPTSVRASSRSPTPRRKTRARRCRPSSSSKACFSLARLPLSRRSQRANRRPSERSRLTGYELATRLSYFLVGTTPDDALLDAAAGGALDAADGVAATARRRSSPITRKGRPPRLPYAKVAPREQARHDSAKPQRSRSSPTRSAPRSPKRPRASSTTSPSGRTARSSSIS
ncbi:MAG: DUF1592 domain-containing protein [Polyangiaceae bacterium]